MNIPDKYRDRYDRLAVSHPWMREMRDEPEVCANRDEWKAKAEQAAPSTCPNGTANGTGNGTCPNSDETCPNDVDSREKLEDDVGFIVKEGFVTYKSIIGWLDRQAAITANETSHDSPYVGLVRGKQWERTEISDYYCGRCGWKVTDHDSYCPECGGALHKASNKPDGKFDAPKTAESGEIRASKDDIRDFDDSREKLEADCTAAWKSVERIVRSGGMPKERWTNSEFFKLLDRQAAITKNEVMVHYRDELSRRDKREKELQAALDQQRAATANANDLWGRTRDELAAVKAERDNLADDLLASNRERESLRRTLGIALDHAHDMLALVNFDGEVVS